MAITIAAELPALYYLLDLCSFYLNSKNFLTQRWQETKKEAAYHICSVAFTTDVYQWQEGDKKKKKNDESMVALHWRISYPSFQAN